MLRRQLVRSFAALSTAAAAQNLSAQSNNFQELTPATYSIFDEWLAAARVNSLKFLNTPAGKYPNYLISFLAMWGAAMPRDTQSWGAGWVELPGANSTLEFNTLSAGRPFVVSAFRMAPGCLLPAHCHPGGGGVTMCLEGSMTLEHFNLNPESPSFRETGKPVRVRYDSSAYLTQERYTWFTPDISNLHQLRAGPEGALGVDLVVQWEGSGEFSFLKFDKGNSTEGVELGHILAGVWSGMNIAEAYS